MKKTILLFALMVGVSLSAQELGALKVTQNKFGLKKVTKVPQKVFIQEFFINYQMLFNQQEVARGGRQLGGGSYRGDAKANLELAVDGVSADNLQEITDALYKDYVSQLTAKGFEIVSAEEAQKNERFKDWNIAMGGTPNAAQFPGYVSCAPTGYSYLVKSTSKSGKEKKRKSIFDNGQGVSKDMGGIVVARVNLAVPFIEDAESVLSKGLTKSFGGIAKIVVKPQLSIVNNISVTGKNKLGLKTTTTVLTNSVFAFKSGLKYQGMLTTTLKKPLIINDVFESKKYKTVSVAKSTSTTNAAAIGSGYAIVSVENRVSSNMQFVPCKSQDYITGVKKGGTAFLNASLSELLENVK